MKELRIIDEADKRDHFLQDETASINHIADSIKDVDTDLLNTLNIIYILALEDVHLVDVDGTMRPVRLFSFGKSSRGHQRLMTHQTNYPNHKLLQISSVSNNTAAESAVKQYLKSQ